MQARKAELSSPLRIYALGIIVLGAISLWVSLKVDAVLDPVPITITIFVTFVALGTGLELAKHRLGRRGGASGSISFVVLIAASLILGPAWGAVITALSVVIAQVASRRAPIKIAFNTAQCVSAIVFGITTYVLLGGSLPPSPLAPWNDALPYVGFVLVFLVVNSSAVSGAIALSEQRPFVDVWVENTLNLTAYDLIASILGLGTALLYMQIGLVGVLALVIPILFIRHTYSVNVQLQQTNRELLDLMVKVIEARDSYTSGHSQRVAQITRILAKGMRLQSRDVETIATAALLHDVGKIYEEFVPIFRKEGKLTAPERKLMETHPVRSADLVGTITSLHGEVYRSVRHHHENFDGSGYPDGLAGEQIPIGARIIMVADTVDAMTTDRPYRRAMPFDRVVEELAKYSGQQFDPEVVSAFHAAHEVRSLIDPFVPSEGPSRVPGRDRTPQFTGRAPVRV